MELYNGDCIISIHALREEGDGLLQQLIGIHRAFLSTPSARRATGVCCCAVKILQISIHALREEGDIIGHILDPDILEFLSTPSARRAT